MRWFRFRPTFEIRIDENREVAIQKLQGQFKKLATKDHFLMFGEYGELHLDPAEHRLWSPHLSFYVLERENACYIHGRFPPRLDVWTSVWIAYLATLFSVFFGAIIAYVQWTLDEPMWGLIIVAVGLLVLMTLYVVANVGQQLSSDQMESLRDRLQTILRDAGIEVSA